MCKICKADIKYTDTKKSGSNILYFDVNIAFYEDILRVYVFFIFVIKSVIKSDVFAFQVVVLKVSIIFKIII